VIPRTLFSPEHEIFRATVNRFIEQEVAPHHAEWERAGVVSRNVWEQAGRSGLLCCNIPTEYGGQGGDFVYSVVMAEEFARAGASGPWFHLHSDIVAPYLLRYGSEHQKRQWLPRMAAGKVIGAVAMTEPRGGSDLRRIETKAIRDGDDFVISGQKVFISNGQLADLVVVAAKTGGGEDAEGITLFLVEGDREGFKRGRNLEKIGLKAQDTSELFFDGVRVPTTNVLGQEGNGFYLLMKELAPERLLGAIKAVAAAEAAIQLTLDYTSTRDAFGQSISSFQNTQFKLAEMAAATTAQRVLVDRCIELHLEGNLSAVDAAIAKLTSTESLCTVTDGCLQLFGGWGYMWEYPIARLYADARAGTIAGGSSEIMKTIIARSMLPRLERD